jgi:hypothetical protein
MLLTEILYYFEHKKPSNLRHIQFLNVGFREKNRKVYIPQI